MTLVDIPERTLKENLRIEKKMKPSEISWWRVPSENLPAQAILAKSTGTGILRNDITVYLIAGHDREVFLGKDMDKFKIHEYVGLVKDTGWQPLVQLGRDVEMV